MPGGAITSCSPPPRSPMAWSAVPAAPGRNARCWTCWKALRPSTATIGGSRPIMGWRSRRTDSEMTNTDLEIAFVDEGIGPDLCAQLSLADPLTAAFNKSDQEIEGATAEADGFVSFQQQPLSRQQPEATK